MNARQINMMLWVVAATLAVGAVAGLLFAVAAPLETAEVPGVGKHVETATTKPAPNADLPSLADLEHVWGVSLHQNLGDAAPPPAAVAAQQPTAPTASGADAGVPVSLVGTIGDSIAMLKTPSNAVEVCAVGETSANGVTVVAVRPAEVDVRFNGRTVTLAKPKDAE
jgi:hypothetical protein